MEIEIIKWLQQFSGPFLDAVMLILTVLGESYVFLVIVLILYWCVDKRYACKFTLCYFAGMFINAALKKLIGRVRPHTASEEVRSIGHTHTSGSIPSGHTQSAAQIATLLCLRYGSRKRKWVYYASGAAVLIVALTRLYLGQHYLTDVVTGAAIGIPLMVIFSRLFDLIGDREDKLMLFIGLPAALLVMIILNNPDFYGYIGGFTGFAAGYYIEKRFICFNAQGSKRFRVIKALIGLPVIAALYVGLDLIISAAFGTDAVSVGYCISMFAMFFTVAVTAVLLLPMLFKRLNKKIA